MAKETISMEQLYALIEKQKAEIDALKGARSGTPVDVKPNGQIAFAIPSGQGTLNVAYYGWHWEQIIPKMDEIRKIIKAGKGPSGNRVISEAEFRQRKDAK
jgi:hypothetical protein